MTPRTAQIFGSVLALLGVVLGAMGAHFIPPFLPLHGTMGPWWTATHYQWFHALALLALAGQVGRGPAICWLLGVLCFSGSLYILTLEPTWWMLGPVTPLGGTLLIVGWVWFLVHLVRRKE